MTTQHTTTSEAEMIAAIKHHKAEAERHKRTSPRQSSRHSAEVVKIRRQLAESRRDGMAG